MSNSNIVKTLCDELIENPALAPTRVDEIAEKLLDAPESSYLPKVERANAILLHPEFSRAVYDRLLDEIPYPTLSKFSNTLHLVLINDNTTLADIEALKAKSDEHDETEWFNESVTSSIAWSEYQLHLAYNGTLMVQDGEDRRRLMRSLGLLKSYEQAS